MRDAFFKKRSISTKPPCNLRSKMPCYNVTITTLYSPISSYYYQFKKMSRVLHLMALIAFASSTTAANGLQLRNPALLSYMSVCVSCMSATAPSCFVCLFFFGSRRTRQSAMEGVDPGSAIRRDWRSTCWSIIYKLTDRNNKPMTGESCYSAQHQLSIVYSNAQSAQ